MHLPPLPAFRLLIGAFLVVLIAGCRHKDDPSAATRLFFERVSSGRMNEAYQSATFAFQSLQSETAFEAIARDIGLAGAHDLQLGTPEIDSGSAKLSADLTSSKGEKLKFIVTMSDEKGEWRLFSLKSPRDPVTGLSENRFSLSTNSGSATFKEASNAPKPDEKALKRLVRDAIMEFDRAIRAKSFSSFYASVSTAWQGQLTEKQLQRAFQGFIDNNVDLSVITGVEPVFDGPAEISSDGLLLVSGHYPSKPYQVFFSLKFIYELPDWKLFGIDITSDPTARQ